MIDGERIWLFCKKTDADVDIVFPIIITIIREKLLLTAEPLLLYDV